MRRVHRVAGNIALKRQKELFRLYSKLIVSVENFLKML
jgi:hypothetical protein